MKKKFIIVSITLFLTSATLLGCNKPFNSEYKDGTYIGSVEDSGYISEEAIVSIKEGKIADINLIKLNSDGKEVDCKNWQNSSQLNIDKINLIDNVILDQNTYKDFYSEYPTIISNWKLSVNNALDKAKR